MFDQPLRVLERLERLLQPVNGREDLTDKRLVAGNALVQPGLQDPVESWAGM